MNEKKLSLYVSQVVQQVGTYNGFFNMRRLGVIPLPLNGMLVHHRITPSIKFAGTHIYTWVERGTVRVKCLAQEHNVVVQPELEPGPLAPDGV